MTQIEEITNLFEYNIQPRFNAFKRCISKTFNYSNTEYNYYLDADDQYRMVYSGFPKNCCDGLADIIIEDPDNNIENVELCIHREGLQTYTLFKINNNYDITQWFTMENPLIIPFESIYLKIKTKYLENGKNSNITLKWKQLFFDNNILTSLHNQHYIVDYGRFTFDYDNNHIKSIDNFSYTKGNGKKIYEYFHLY
jgi:hypothetical protein